MNNISFEVHAGEVFGFGPNGAGKTTSMRMIAGLLKPTSGHISIDNYDFKSKIQEAKRISSFIPDRPYLYEKLTAFEFSFSWAVFTSLTAILPNSVLKKCLNSWVERMAGRDD